MMMTQEERETTSTTQELDKPNFEEKVPLITEMRLEEGREFLREAARIFQSNGFTDTAIKLNLQARDAGWNGYGAAFTRRELNTDGWFRNKEILDKAASRQLTKEPVALILNAIERVRDRDSVSNEYKAMRPSLMTLVIRACEKLTQKITEQRFEFSESIQEQFPNAIQHKIFKMVFSDVMCASGLDEDATFQDCPLTRASWKEWKQHIEEKRALQKKLM